MPHHAINYDGMHINQCNFYEHNTLRAVLYKDEELSYKEGLLHSDGFFCGTASSNTRSVNCEVCRTRWDIRL